MFKQLFAFESIEQYERHAEEIQLLSNKLDDYKSILINQFELQELPK